MAGATVPLAFPYPTGTDRVADGDNAMQALAEKIDDYLAGETKGVTLQPGIDGTLEGSESVRRGGVGYLRICINSPGGVAAGTKVLVVGAGHRPLVNVRFIVTKGVGVGAVGFPMTLYTNGDCHVEQTLTANNAVVGTVAYPLPQ